MKFFRKNLFSLTAFAFLSFFSVLAIEGAHHHDSLESHDDCSICAWQATGSQASSTPASPTLLFYALILPFFFTLVIFHFSPFFLSPSGRSPPKNLL